MKEISRQARIKTKATGKQAFADGYTVRIPSGPGTSVLTADQAILFKDGQRLTEAEFIDRWTNETTGGTFRDAWKRTIAANSPQGRVLKQLITNANGQMKVMRKYSDMINSQLGADESDQSNISYSVTSSTLN